MERIDGSIKARQAVVLHSYNPNEPNWEYVVWGIPPDQPGRIPTAVAAVLEKDAGLLLLFASNVQKEGKSGGRHMKDILYERMAELKNFAPVLPVFNLFSTEEILSKVEQVLELSDAPEILNTSDELKAALPILQDRAVDEVVFVSSPDHVSRIVKEIGVLWRGQVLALHASVRGSCTLYGPKNEQEREQYGMEHVVIFEIPASRVLGPQRFFKIMRNPEALSEVDAVLKRYGA